MAATCSDIHAIKGSPHEQDRSERPLRRRHRRRAGFWTRDHRALCRFRRQGRDLGSRPAVCRKGPRRKSATAVTAFKVDVSDLAAVEKTRDATLKAFGKIDILVNNAGIAGVNKTVWETDLDEWRKVLRINLDGPFICCKAVVPAMLAQEIRPHRQHRLDRRQGRQSERRALFGLQGRPDRADEIARQGTGAARHPRQRGDAGRRQDRDLRPADASSISTSCCRRFRRRVSCWWKNSRRWWRGWRRKTARSRPARCSTSPAAGRRTSPDKNCENNPMHSRDGVSRRSESTRSSGFKTAAVAGSPRRPVVVAIQMPANTVTMPPTRFQPSGSCSSIAPTSDAAIGLTVTEMATRVGVVRASANAQR